MIDISIIIPHKNYSDFLLRLLNTIPDRDSIEVVIVDYNSTSRIVKRLKNQKYNQNVKIIYSNRRYLSGARNIGLDNVLGKWVIFADADDYFSEDFFELTSKFSDNKEDIIYFGINSVTESGDTSYRHLRYMKLIKNYLKNQQLENELKFCFLGAWGKMIKRELIERYNIRFKEILCGEDNLFSLKVANSARKIRASSNILYILTQNESSISKTFDRNHFHSKFNAALQANEFLCSINQSRYQQSILYFLGRSYKFGIKYLIYVIKQLIKYQSNIFIGSRKILNFKEVIKRRE